MSSRKITVSEVPPLKSAKVLTTEAEVVDETIEQSKLEELIITTR
jgi:hypothetical protein